MDFKDTHQSFYRYDLFLENEKQNPNLLSENKLLQKVAEEVAKGDELNVQDAVAAALEIAEPQTVINQGLILGMDEVSRLWNEGTYFLPQVILSSDAMMTGIALCEEKMGKASDRKGIIVSHVAEGDIHDIGQMIVNALLRAAGFEVINLGVDVPVDQVVQACLEYRPVILTGSALMTTTMSAFPRIAAKLTGLNRNIPFVCGGGAVNEEFVNSFDLGIWSRDPTWTVGIANEVLQGYSWQQLRTKWNA